MADRKAAAGYREKDQLSYTEIEGVPEELALKGEDQAAKAREPYLHIYHNNAVCETDQRGAPTPGGRSPFEIVVDATEGFIPLWASGTTLRWRFNEASMQVFVNPTAAKGYLRELLAAGIALWEDASPVRFHEADEAWDFELKVTPRTNCSQSGCTLARAFFPDSGQHDILFYPTLFQQTREEQIETLAHEVGHVFGLRHFFAQITETRWRSEIFGDHEPFSIMNYGAQSRMSDADKRDLKTLYMMAWAGTLTEINGTPIKLVRPFSTNRLPECEPRLVAAVRPGAGAAMS